MKHRQQAAVLELFTSCSALVAPLFLVHPGGCPVDLTLIGLALSTGLSLAPAFDLTVDASYCCGGVATAVTI